MAFVPTIPIESASGLVKEHYAVMPRVTGVNEVGHLIEAWSLQPEVAEAWRKSLQTARQRAGLDEVLFELLECRIMYVLKCRYVLTNHSFLLAKVSGWDRERIKRYVRQPQTSDLGAREKALLAFGEKLAARSHQITQADVDAIRGLGFSDEQYVALVFTISALVANAIFPNALGPEPDGFSRDYRDVADW
jgi:alkylhydroperoxidase family enzyme